MPKAVVNDSSLAAIADSIRKKKGSADKYKPSEMSSAIESIKCSPVSASFRGYNGESIQKEINNLDSSKIKDMSYMLAEIKNFNNIDVSKMDTSNSTSMTAMFYNSTYEGLDLNNFETSNVTLMNSMFQACRSLIKLDVSSFDTSKVTNMAYMLTFCVLLEYLDLSSFDTSNVTAMNNMFTEMNSLVEIKGIIDMQNVTNASNMISYCQKLKEIRLKNLKTNLLMNTAISLSEDSVNYLLLNVQDVSVAPKTITLGPNMPKASKEALEHATSLGWTVI